MLLGELKEYLLNIFMSESSNDKISIFDINQINK